MDDHQVYGGISSNPEREAELHIAAVEGIERADLTPLVELLRSEFQLNEFIGLDIADAIEGKHSSCKILAKHARRGKPSGDLQLKQRRDAQILAFIEARNGEGYYESSLREAMSHFSLNRTSITNAVRRAKERRAWLRDKLSKKHFSIWESQIKES